MRFPLIYDSAMTPAQKAKGGRFEPAALRLSVFRQFYQCGVRIEFPDASAAIANAATV